MNKVIHYLQTPVTEEQVRSLRIGDVVYLDGTVFTARDLAHMRLISMGKNNERIPFDLNGGVIWHCGPVVRQRPSGKWEMTSAGPTTSIRLTKETPYMFEKYGVRLIVGKGGMGKQAVDAMGRYGAVFLSATGGCAVVFAEQVETVANVFWEKEIGLPEAVWELHVRKFGALVVSIDTTGANLYQKVMTTAAKNTTECYEMLGISDPEVAMIHWPPALSGTKDVPAGMIKVGGGA